jgi:hypothetical protein
MEILVIVAIHAAITYTFSRLVKSEGFCIAFTWLNVFIAGLTGNPFFSGIDIVAVFVGGIIGKIHRENSEKNKITENSIKKVNVTNEENAKIEANPVKNEPIYKPEYPPKKWIKFTCTKCGKSREVLDAYVVYCGTCNRNYRLK